MKELILKNLKTYKELKSEEILELNNDEYLNSTLKLNLLKDKSKGAKVSESKFYLSDGDVLIKCQYDDVCKKLTLLFSKDAINLGDFFKTLDSLNIKKFEVYINKSFNELQASLKASGFFVELIRVDRFYNNGQYENEVVLSKIKEGV